MKNNEMIKYDFDIKRELEKAYKILSKTVGYIFGATNLQYYIAGECDLRPIGNVRILKVTMLEDYYINSITVKKSNGEEIEFKLMNSFVKISKDNRHIQFNISSVDTIDLVLDHIKSPTYGIRKYSTVADFGKLNTFFAKRPGCLYMIEGLPYDMEFYQYSRNDFTGDVTISFFNWSEPLAPRQFDLKFNKESKFMLGFTLYRKPNGSLLEDSFTYQDGNGVWKEAICVNNYRRTNETICMVTRRHMGPNKEIFSEK